VATVTKIEVVDKEEKVNKTFKEWAKLWK